MIFDPLICLWNFARQVRYQLVVEKFCATNSSHTSHPAILYELNVIPFFKSTLAKISSPFTRLMRNESALKLLEKKCTAIKCTTILTHSDGKKYKYQFFCRIDGLRHRNFN